MSAEPTATVSDPGKEAPLRQTLVLGVGGTGHQVVAQLKARLLETYGPAALGPVKLLVLDTPNEPLGACTQDGTSVTLDRESEYLCVGNVPVRQMLRGPDEKTTAQAWLPPELRVVADLPEMGATTRPLGRLAFFHHYREGARLHRSLLEIMRAFGNAASGRRGGPGYRYRRGPSVFLVTSLCGGTGSGMFLDAAYAVRTALSFSGLPAEAYLMAGFLVLPGAFPWAAPERTMPNAYAALRELSHFILSVRFEANYPDGFAISERSRPFDLCYLVDGVNERGAAPRGMEDLGPMLAESLLQHLGLEAGGPSDPFSSVSSVWKFDRGEPTAFSGLGAAALVYPARRIAAASALRLSQEMVGEGLLKPAAGDPDALARGFAARAGLTPQALVSALRLDAAGQPIGARIEPPAVQPGRRWTVVGDTLAAADEHQAGLLEGALAALLDENHKKQGALAAGQLREEVARLFDSPERGPRTAQRFLDFLLVRLTSSIDSLRDEGAAAGAQVLQAQKTARGLLGNLVRATGSLALGRKGRIVQAQRDYLAMREADLSGRLEGRICTLAASLLEELSVLADALAREVAGLVEKLGGVQAILQRQAAVLGDPAAGLPAVLTAITTPEDVERIFQAQRPEVGTALERLAAGAGSLFALCHRPGEEVAAVIAGFARDHFRPVTQATLEELVTQKGKEVSPRQRLEALRESAVPCWSYDRTRTPESELDTLQVIAVPDGERTLFREALQRGEVLLSTYDPHYMAVLRTHHGLPMSSLAPIDRWREQYEECIKRGAMPVHVFPGFPVPES